MDIPETRYAKTQDGAHIAYQTLGDGPTDMVLLPGICCVDVMWEEPSYAEVLHRLAGIGRLVCFDRSGLGSSDPVRVVSMVTPEARMEEIHVVLNAVDSTTATLIAHGAAGSYGMLFAATYPERTDRLILINTSARTLRSDDYPFGRSAEEFERFIERTEDVWGTGAAASYLAPSRSNDAAFQRWHAKFERLSQSPGTFADAARWSIDVDLRAILPAIRVPTLVLHREKARMTPLGHGQYLADHIPDARLVLLPGADFYFFTSGADDFVNHVSEFVTGAPSVREPDRVLATVLFTDIVASTDHAARLGDKRWTELLNQLDRIVDRELGRHRGRKVNPTGDGMLATFDGPARAVRCAQALDAGARSLGIEVRAGLHTGEVELRGDDIGGIAVHIGQRVSALAGPGEVLVSRTVTDLVAGSGLEFQERGEHELKGVPGKWAIYAVKT